MKKSTLFKILFGIIALVMVLMTAYGIFFIPLSAGKLVCGGLGILGFALAGTVYAVCRSEVIQIADALENTLLAAEQGHLPNALDLSDESLTQRVCLRAVRLTEAVRSKAQETETNRLLLQATVSDLAHQLRAPMANLILYADTLAVGDMPPKKQAEFLAVLGGQARKLEFLLEALVKTSRLETGMIHMTAQMMGLKGTLYQAFALAEPLAKAKGLAITLDCPENLLLSHDPKWTAEAVFNLLDNAIKYTSNGSVTLVARRWEIYTCIEVADTGIGFAQDASARLFSRFYRAQETAAAPGVGLGLCIVRQIAILQGGYVQAKALEQGAVFRLFLPNI